MVNEPSDLRADPRKSTLPTKLLSLALMVQLSPVEQRRTMRAGFLRTTSTALRQGESRVGLRDLRAEASLSDPIDAYTC